MRGSTRGCVMTAAELRPARRPRLRRPARNAAGPVGLVILAVMALLCFGAPLIEQWSGRNPLAVDLAKLGLSDLAQSSDLSLYRIVAIIALTGWTLAARLVRGATLSVRTRDYVAAARVAGAGPLRLMVVHILPNVASPLLVATT